MKYGIGAELKTSGANPCVPPPRDCVSVQVLKFAERLAQRAGHINGLANDKLFPVIRSATPEACKKESSITEEYPPLFADLKCHLLDIESALDGIETVLGRTEL
jgi:hypothetical protein